MVVQVVTEILDVADRRVRDLRVGEVPREKHEGHVADVVCLDQTGEVTELERGVASRVEDLGRALDGGEAPRVDEFLRW